MQEKNRVLVIGIEPSLIDFTAPDFANSPGLNAEKVLAGLKKDEAALTQLGYDAQLCLTDLGETAAAVVESELQQRRYDCIVIGAGIRVLPSNFLLFEKLVNVVHAHAPEAKLCFNTKPEDTAEAVQRWV